MWPLGNQSQRLAGDSRRSTSSPSHARLLGVSAPRRGRGTVSVMLLPSVPSPDSLRSVVGRSHFVSALLAREASPWRLSPYVNSQSVREQRWDVWFGSTCSTDTPRWVPCTPRTWNCSKTVWSSAWRTSEEKYSDECALEVAVTIACQGPRGRWQIRISMLA